MQKQIDNENYTVSYNVYGSGTPIVLIHGFPLDGKIWDAIIPELSKCYKVIVPDLPGTGKSVLKANELSIEQLADVVNKALVAEDIGNAIIVGHSMGGYIALAFADVYKEKVKGLGLVHSSATADSDEKKEQRRKTIALIEKGGKEPFIKQMVPNLFASGSDKKQEQKLILERSLLTENKTLSVFYNAMINRPDRTYILENKAFPVLWVLGKEDNIADYRIVIQQSTIADVSFIYTYNQCGHLSMVEKPQQLVVDLISFADYCI